MNGDSKAALYITGAILAGSGGITIGLGTIARNAGNPAITVGLLLLIAGATILVFNSTLFENIIRNVRDVLTAPFRWIAHVHRSQWH